MERIGEITAVYGGEIEVTFCRPDDCEHCHACDGQEKRTVVRMPGSGRVGDYAAVELPASTVVKASLLAYALPIAGLMGGMGLGALFFPASSATAAALGALGLLGTLLWVWLTEKKRRADSAWHPTLNRVLPRELYQPKTNNDKEEQTK